ncbi:Stk1 family PASTA domain-containing Ser/Thr kinase [Nocardioides houyundeii]|uniref:Stk1 family PASTA domain-containing Ser/Thr kinase n=1 Tax=Nocardioides houyundeii TaxID=2045452 RepID=UPI001F53705A|nr:Stk1 family PASTA domain-containing Ser/Thr kinase [Nocardioides houyundeii]
MEPDQHAPSRTPRDSGDPMVGRTLERRYRILRRIARGGMASVYEAVDTRLDRVVAVKVMHPGLGDDEEFVARFVREARAAAGLSHPNIVSVYDQGEDDGTVFLAMEYVPGHTLRDVIRKESPMAPARALALLDPVLSALATAHRAGLVHRDIKPENVLIADEPGGSQVKVADFGLAKAVSAHTQHTATGVLIGTVSYLAPELVVQGRADERADVYAVGVILYELLTGTKPHDGESQIQVAYQHVHEDVPAPSAKVPGIPAYVDALVARATARDRSQRSADASVLLHQVHRVAQTLRDGLLEDPELEADLRPLPAHAPLEVEEAADRDGLVDIEDPADHDIVPFPTEPRRDEQVDHTRQIQTLPAPSAPPAIHRLPPARTDLPDEPRDRPRRSRRGPVLLAIALVLVVGLGVGAWWFGFARYTTTPGVLGMAEAEAVSSLEDAGLETELGDPAYSETVPAGSVLSTDPDPGARVTKGGTVTLVVSQGLERYDVPALEGKDLDAAQDAVTSLNLTYGRAVERFSESVPAGVVMSSDPPAGTTLKPGATVNVVVSKGRKPRTVTDFTGRSAERAQQVLEKRKLVVTREEVFNDDVPAGEVISQSPSSGTLFKGETVALVVSRGPELVEMPNVVASGVDAAREQLEALGFDVETRESRTYIGLGFVLSTDPDAGESVPKGSTITLSLI